MDYEPPDPEPEPATWQDNLRALRDILTTGLVVVAAFLLAFLLACGLPLLLAKGLVMAMRWLFS